MISIRFLRIGRKNQPSYKIVAVDQRRAPKSGKFIEQLGFYNPITKEKSVNKERVEYWLSVGAQASDTVHNLLVSEGIIKAKKRAVHSTKRKKKEEKSPEEKPAEGDVLKESVPITTQSVAGGEVKEVKEEAVELSGEAPKEEAKKEKPAEAKKEEKEESKKEPKPKEEKKEKEAEQESESKEDKKEEVEEEPKKEVEGNA